MTNPSAQTMLADGISASLEKSFTPMPTIKQWETIIAALRAASAPAAVRGRTMLEQVADAIDRARYAHPIDPRERPHSFEEAPQRDREYSFRLARAALTCAFATPEEAQPESVNGLYQRRPAASLIVNDADWTTAAPPAAQTEGVRQALEKFTAHYEPWMDQHADDVECIVHSRHTFGDLRRARAAMARTPHEIAP